MEKKTWDNSQILDKTDVFGEVFIEQKLWGSGLHSRWSKSVKYTTTQCVVPAYIVKNDSEGWKWDRKNEDPIDTQIEALCKICCKALTVCSKSLPSHKRWEKEFAQRVVRLSIYKFSSWNKRQHTVWETGNERHFLQRSGFCYSKGTRVQWALLTFVAILEGQEESSIERRETKPRWITKTFCVSSACNPNNLWGRNETNELPCVLLLSSHTRGKKIQSTKANQVKKKEWPRRKKAPTIPSRYERMSQEFQALKFFTCSGGCWCLTTHHSPLDCVNFNVQLQTIATIAFCNWNILKTQPKQLQSLT